jgi:predicted dithiol-disulfide oxidoreductase (DUF899 family)
MGNFGASEPEIGDLEPVAMSSAARPGPRCMNIGTRQEWLEARQALLVREKDLTRQGDAIAKERQALPWVPVEQEYVFATNAGPKTLAELFDGRSQLLVYHFMHGPLTPEGCPGCSYHADSFSGMVTHLNHQDATFLCVSRSPLDALNAYKERMGWTFPWISAGDNGFTDDFAVFDPGGGIPDYGPMELMGFSAFALVDGVPHHTYTTFDRGTEIFNPVWQLLDRTPLGRRQLEGWPRKHDEYAKA